METLLLAFLVLVPATFARADENATPLVDGEYFKSQAQFQTRLSKAARKLLEIDALRKTAIGVAESEATVDSAGIEAFNRYEALINSRYVDENGELEVGLEVSADDVTNLNKLFDTYLHATPLRGRVSAGFARQTLNWGKSRLQEIYKMHRSPNENNNSDLQILAKQARDAQKEIKTIRELASRLGVKLVTPDPEHPEVDGEDMRLRAPASDEE